MSGLIAAGSSDWSTAGAILTFAFPMILFIVVGTALWVLYTKPHVVPGHRYQPDVESMTATQGIGRVPRAGGPAGGGAVGQSGSTEK